MSLDRLPSTIQQRPSRDAVEQAQHAASAAVRRVEAMEGAAGDRERSLRQELDQVPEKAVGPFEGEARIVENAQDVARQIACLGPRAVRLVGKGRWPGGIDARV